MTRVAYLNTQYPSLSHTFIEREVRGVRARGVEVETFSVRDAGASGRLGSAHAAAAAETRVVLTSPAAVVLSFLAGALTSPLGALRAVVESQRLAPAGVRARFLHLAYALEGVRLARMLRASGLTHVHVHMANSGAMVALLATTYDRRLRYSLTIHGSAEFFDTTRLRLGAKAERAAFVRCISGFCRAQVMMWSDPEAWPRYHVVPTGVDPRVFVPPGERPQDRLRLVTVGRMVPVKGYDVLLEACAALTRDGVPWSLEMIGDGPTLPRLRALAGRLGIADRVTFAGAVAQDELPARLAAANVMVVSSFMEGVPVVLMEAMSTGMAVVSTRVGGVAELVRDGCDGVLVDAGSAEPLASALRSLASDPARREELGSAARRRVQDAYDVEDATTRMAELLQRHAPERP